MSKYGLVTYKSRKRTENTGAQRQFDQALAEKDKQEKAERCRKRELEMSRKSGLNVKRVGGVKADKKRKLNLLLEDDLFGFNNVSDSEVNDTSSCKSSPSKSPAKRKSPAKQNSTDKSPLQRDSTFNITSPSKDNSQFKRNSPFKDLPLNGKKKTLKLNGTDEGNEVCCSLQESGETKDAECVDSDHDEKKIQKQSPFKYFLKNNVVSLSPKKKKRLGYRFSALPTNMAQTDDTIIEEEDCEDIPKLTRSTSCPTEASSSRVRVKREEKQLFTVVRNVKHKHACLEDGETQQFFDDVDFALDGLRQEMSLASRCSSALEIAAQCSTSSFRTNLRAHGIISKIFESLQDAPTNKTLALCCSCVFFMITRDQLSVDFDRSILELLLKLLYAGKQSSQNKINGKKNLHEEMVKKTRHILTRQPESHTVFLDMENLSSKMLARESLLSLTPKRTGEWFKEELRKLGGLDYIVDLILTTVVDVKDDAAELVKHEKGIESVERCLKLIENVTYQNQENQIYLVACRTSYLVIALTRLLRVCIQGIAGEGRHHPRFQLIVNCVKSILRVFLNLTHDNHCGSDTIGQQDGLISMLLFCALQIPQYVSVEEQFDILVLVSVSGRLRGQFLCANFLILPDVIECIQPSEMNKDWNANYAAIFEAKMADFALGLLINLMEHSKQNIASLVVVKTQFSYEDSQSSSDSQDSGKVETKSDVPAVEALVNLFLLRKQAAKELEGDDDAEDEVDDELRPTKDGLGWVCGEDIDVTRTEDPDATGKPENEAEEKQEKSLEEELTEVLQNAGKHMENSMVASYVALLLGCLAKDNNANQYLIRQLLPENSFDELINTLKTFLGFMKLTSGTTNQAIEKIITVLQNC